MYCLAAQDYRFAISSATVYELLRGDNQNEDHYWKTMCVNMKVLSFYFACAEQAARVYQDLKQRGQLIEVEDLLIGATALHHRLKLATGNRWHFERIAGLVLLYG